MILFEGEIIGKVRSFGNTNSPGLTVFDNKQQYLTNETRLDRKYKFTIKSQDKFGSRAIEREFSITQ